MLAQDRLKVINPYLSINTGAPFAQRRAFQAAWGMPSVVPQLDGLGQFGDILDFVGNVVQGFNTVSQDMNTMSQSYSFGSGHEEANYIVPIQNAVVSQVIAPILAIIDPYKGHEQDLGYDVLNQLHTILKTTQDRWLSFLHNTQWNDGRAAIQAEQTLQPYFG